MGVLLYLVALPFVFKNPSLRENHIFKLERIMFPFQSVFFKRNIR